jgi:hypothetical protein
MQRHQTKIRLNVDVENQLRNQAKRQGLTYNELCERILEEGVSKLGKNRFLLVTDALVAKLEIISSQTRSRKTSTPPTKHVKCQKYE